MLSKILSHCKVVRDNVANNANGILKTGEQTKGVAKIGKHVVKVVPQSDKKINIAFLAPACRNGGRARVSQILTTELSKRKGYNVYWFSGKPPKDAFEVGKNVHREVVYEDGKLSEKKVKNAVKKKNIDVLIYQEWSLDGAKLLKSLGKKIISICHITFMSSLYCGAPVCEIFRKISAVKFSDVVCCLTQMDVELLKRHGINNAIYLPNPLTFNPDDITQSSLTTKNIVMVGRPDRLKRFEFGIRAMAKVVKTIPDAKLQIIGKDKNQYFDELKALVEELGLKNNVEFCGYQNDVGKFYKNASAFILSSLYECSPMVLVEAKAYGLPNIVTGMNYLETTKSGTIRVGADDIDGISDEIIKLFTDEKYRNEQGKLARESLNSFKTSNTIDKWEEMIQAVLKGSDDVQKFIKKQPVANAGDALQMIQAELDLAIKRNPVLKGLTIEDLFKAPSKDKKQLKTNEVKDKHENKRGK